MTLPQLAEPWRPRMGRRFWLVTPLQERSLVKPAMIPKFRRWCTWRHARRTRARTLLRLQPNSQSRPRAQGYFGRMAFFGFMRKLSSEISPVTLNRPELAHCPRFKGEALMRCQTRKPQPLHGELNPRGIKFRPQTALSIRTWNDSWLSA